MQKFNWNLEPSTAVRPASTLKYAVILAATLFSGARVYYALR